MSDRSHPINETDDEITEATHWQKLGWIARVVRNEDDEGWAVEMTRVGDSEPALVAPWTMGRDKKNPKPLDAPSFATWVKTASEILMRHEQSLRALMHQSRTITTDAGLRVRVDLDIVQDEDDPRAVLTAVDEQSGEQVGNRRVSPSFKLTESSAQRFVRTGDA